MTWFRYFVRGSAVDPSTPYVLFTVTSPGDSNSRRTELNSNSAAGSTKRFPFVLVFSRT